MYVYNLQVKCIMDMLYIYVLCVYWAIQKITQQGGGCKSLIVLIHVALENWQTAKMPPAEKAQKNMPLTWNFLPLQSYNEWKYDFQFRSPEKFHLKLVKGLENSNLWTYPHEILFSQKGPEILHPTPPPPPPIWIYVPSEEKHFICMEIDDF